ncbi:NAD-dependent epimerase/dehydratase family protein [candidate division WOR-3 bacterium]|nr:NAD-dependent epimerase/dehydratase family protein [candidate division WOR-3 bacterium]
MSEGWKWQDKLVLVTGATGLLGGLTARRLLAEGARVRGLARNPARAAELAACGAEIVAGDITDELSLARAAKGCQGVFHFAGVLANEFRPRSYFQRVNVEGTRNLAEAALTCGAERFLYCSTVWVYGLAAGTDTDESTPHRYSGEPYCDTKLDAEEVIREFTRDRGLPAVIVQPTEVFGPDDRNWTLGPLELIRSGRMMLASGGIGLVQLIYQDDVAEGILAAARHGRLGEAYILGGGTITTIREYFLGLARIAGQERLPSVPSWLALVAAGLEEFRSRLSGRPPVFTRGGVRGTMVYATYRTEKAAAELGFVAKTGFATGLERIRERLSASH